MSILIVFTIRILADKIKHVNNLLI